MGHEADTPASMQGEGGGAARPAAAPISRDAEATKQRLIRAATSRFAREGYAATTVRDITSQAGVNVALVSRYFDSKEGLFSACLDAARTQILAVAPERTTSVEETADALMVGLILNEQAGEALRLLLRSSGNEVVDSVRKAALTHAAQSIAATPGFAGQGESERARLLRAEATLSVVAGLVLLRWATRLEPLTSASEDELRATVGRALTAVMRPA